MKLAEVLPELVSDMENALLPLGRGDLLGQVSEAILERWTYDEFSDTAYLYLTPSRSSACNSRFFRSTTSAASTWKPTATAACAASRSWMESALRHGYEARRFRMLNRLVREGVAMTITDPLKDALNLAQRFQQGALFRQYVVERMWLVVPAALLMLATSLALAFGIVMYVGGTRPLTVLLSLLIAPFVLVGSLFVQAYLFLAWLEGRALAKSLGRRARKARGRAVAWASASTPTWAACRRCRGCWRDPRPAAGDPVLARPSCSRRSRSRGLTDNRGMRIDGGCHCGRSATRPRPTRRKPASATAPIARRCPARPTSRSSRCRRKASQLRGKPKIYVKTAERQPPRAGVLPLRLAPAGLGRSFNLRLGTVRQRAQLAPKSQVWCNSALPWAMNLGAVKHPKRCENLGRRSGVQRGARCSPARCAAIREAMAPSTTVPSSSSATTTPPTAPPRSRARRARRWCSSR